MSALQVPFRSDKNGFSLRSIISHINIFTFHSCHCVRNILHLISSHKKLCSITQTSVIDNIPPCTNYIKCVNSTAMPSMFRITAHLTYCAEKRYWGRSRTLPYEIYYLAGHYIAGTSSWLTCHHCYLVYVFVIIKTIYRILAPLGAPYFTQKFLTR